mmetsp:Transcript_22209/g.18517  ORF Transcript_22209/g.18517 Transcript_22209/m.18517 type:complete len:83 (-) Transcript_22209:553-801(-)
MTIRIYNVMSSIALKILSGHTGSVSSLLVFTTPNESLLISGSDDSTIKIWNIDSGKCVRTIGHDSPITTLTKSYSKLGGYFI